MEINSRLNDSMGTHLKKLTLKRQKYLYNDKP